MNRTTMVKTVIGLQVLLGLLLMGITVYLFALTRSREILSEPDAADTIHGLLIGAGVVSIPAVITLLAVVGLWKGKFWGWVVSLATNVGLLAVLVYNNVGASDLDTNEVALSVVFLVLTVLLLLPAVRKFYWRAGPRS